MTGRLRVGIVGCGTAGPALALLLQEQGHDVEILERVDAPQAIGAGIMLQDLGQQVMGRLGLGDELARRSRQVRRVDATTMHGRVVMDFRYADLPGGVPALGVHRGTLFDLLDGAVRQAGIRVRTGVEVTDVRPTSSGMTTRTPDGTAAGHYDLVVGADGTRSAVRESVGLTRRDRPYPYGALWAVVDDPDHLSGDTLYQRYDGTRRNLGVLPPDSDKPASSGRSRPATWRWPSTPASSTGARRPCRSQDRMGAWSGGSTGCSRHATLTSCAAAPCVFTRAPASPWSATPHMR